MMTGYAETYRLSLERPEEFWAGAAEAIDWERRWDRVLDDSTPPFFRWFAGGRLNTCWNAVDRHVAAGRGERVALIWDSPVTGQSRYFNYLELRDEIARLAGVLASLGVAKGDRVLIYMPMVPEAAFAMLACARIGAIHSVVFGGFAAHELATRINDAKPRVILSACSGRCAMPSWCPDTTTTGGSLPRQRDRRTACRCSRPIRSTSSIPRARPASPRASSATMAGMRSRSTGRCGTSTACSRTKCSGPPPMSAG